MNNISLFAGILLVFFISPFLATIVILCLAFYHRRSEKLLYVAVGLLVLINITVDWQETDYRWYLPLFKSALHIPFHTYIWSLSSAKEPVYTIITFILSYVFIGSSTLFSIFSNFVFYFFMMAGLNVIRASLNINRIYWALAVCVLLFFPYIFANSANHVRQYWGTAIVFFSLVKYLIEKKKKYLALAATSVLIHTSSGLILLLALIPFMGKKLTLRTSLYYLGAFVALLSLSSIAKFLFPFFGEGLMGHALNKAIIGTTFETEFTISKLLFAIIVVGVPYFVINVSQFSKHSGVMKLMNVQLMLVIMIAANLKQEEFWRSSILPWMTTL